MGISKAIGPGRRIVASLSPGLRVLPVSRNFHHVLRDRPHPHRCAGPGRKMQTARGEPPAGWGAGRRSGKGAAAGGGRGAWGGGGVGEKKNPVPPPAGGGGGLVLLRLLRDHG